MLASSLGAEVLIMGMVVLGMGNGTYCASIPLVVGTKAKNGSCGGAMVALGIGGLPTLRVPTLELAASNLFGTTPSITPFLFKSLLDYDEVGFGANSRINSPCQVKSCTTHSSIVLYNMAYLLQNIGVIIMVGLIHK